MAIETKELEGGRIRLGRIEMDYRHRDETLTSVYPLAHQGYFQRVMGNITARKLLRPTTAQTFSLIDFALNNPDSQECKDIISIVNYEGLWTATENLWGDKDVIIYDNVDGKMPTDRKSLIKRMKDGDKSVRVAPYQFKSRGSQSISDFVTNPFIIGQVGDGDFAEEVVARVAKRISTLKPNVLNFLPYACLLLPIVDTHTFTLITSKDEYSKYGLTINSDRNAACMGCASGVVKKRRR